MALKFRRSKRPPKGVPSALELKRKTAWSFGYQFRACPLEPATAELQQRVTAHRADYLCELGWDGHRVVACRAGDDVRLFASDMREWTGPFAQVALAVKQLKASELVLDGFVCVLDDAGRPSFDRVKAWASGKHDGRLAFAVWDLLMLEGEDLRPQPLKDRRAKLSALLTGAGEPIVLSDPLPQTDLPQLRASLEQLGVHGVVARRWDGPYPGVEPWAVMGSAPVRSLSAAPKVTNAQKVLYPRDGIRKDEIVAYYAEIAPVMLPYMRDRPIICQRWPDGIDDFTWFQHRVPPRAPDYLKAVMIEGNRRILIDNAEALTWMANQAALVFHGWMSRVRALEEPDWVVIDLDPGPTTPWATQIQVALALRKLLELLELPSVVKTSGQTGLHVLVPIAVGHTPVQAHALARQLAVMIAELMPNEVSVVIEKDVRRGRLLIDHLQNFTGKSLVLPYSLRANDGACVSTPIGWDEVTPALDPSKFKLRTMRARLDAKGDLAAPLLEGRAQLGPVLARLGL